MVTHLLNMVLRKDFFPSPITQNPTYDQSRKEGSLSEQ